MVRSSHTAHAVLVFIQCNSSKIREWKLWHIKEQFGRGLNLAATSALGHVTAALASAVPELESTPINTLTDDMRSFVFDGAVRSVPSVRSVLPIFLKEESYKNF